MSVKDAFGSAWNFVATADRLLKLETKTNETMAGIQAQVTALDKRLNDLEHRVDRLADECKAAARAGAQEAMMGTLTTLAQQIARLEAGTMVSKPKAAPKRVAKPKPAEKG